jgi:peptidoglycan/LPS O-acetylase OafA/YrhL
MPPDRERSRTFPFIEGLRGCAALQVVALHYCSFFLPTLVHINDVAHFDWETAVAVSPLFYLLDGYSAVYLFFIMSGFVLARSLGETRLGIPAAIAKRFLRLFLPAGAAIIVALVLIVLMPTARVAAQALSGSLWAANPYSQSPSMLGVLKEIFLSSVLLGYQDLPGSILWVRNWLPSASDALIPPLWTLHVEFWGSMLVLLLAQLRRRLPPRLFLPLLAGVAVAFGLDQFGMFVIGFAAYVVHDRLIRLGFGIVAGCALILLAAWMAVYAPSSVPRGLVAALTFAAALTSAPLRHGLARSWALRLGRLSFSIYLLHYPAMFTIGAAAFVAAAPLGYLPAVAMSLIAGMLVTLALAELFERLVDRRAIAWAGRIAVRMAGARAAASDGDATSSARRAVSLPGSPG